MNAKADLLVWDIETRPLPDDELRAMMPPVDLSKFDYGEFDPDSVKLGNRKNPESIANHIEDCRKKHSAKVKSARADAKEAEESAWLEWKSKATLDPTSSRICQLFLYAAQSGKHARLDGDEDEAEAIAKFWSLAEKAHGNGRTLVGVNDREFDRPYICLRSIALGVEIPTFVFKPNGAYTNWSPMFVDLRDRFRFGRHPGSCKSSFDHMGRHFGTGGKSQGNHGGTFYQLWDDDQEKALAYGRNDVEQPAIWAERLGVR